MTHPCKRSTIRKIVVPSLQRLARQEVERIHHFMLLYLLPCAFLDDFIVWGWVFTLDTIILVRLEKC